jgi:RNA polymerase sigma factor FliA
MMECAYSLGENDMSSMMMENLKCENTTENYVMEYAPLVKKIAHHLLFRMPAIVHVDDLIQAGMIGLIEAANNFDQSKGASFSTYAGIRIRGAMLDEIRRGNWAPRSVHRNSRKVAAAVREIENQTKRDPRDIEVADKLGVSLEEYHQYRQDTGTARVYAYEDISMFEETLESLTINPIAGPLEKLQSEDFREKLSLEIAKLPEKEKHVLILYYEEDLNLREVGEVLGVSESRISQIHSQAMTRLKARLASWQ